MKRRTIVWIILGVIGAHVAAFSVIGRMNPLPKTRIEPLPTFSYKATSYTDPATGEKIIERRIRVSTKLAAPGTYESRPPVPAEEIAAEPQTAAAQPVSQP